jgi:hypothetical protein
LIGSIGWMWVRIGRKWRWRKRSQRWKAFPIAQIERPTGATRGVLARQAQKQGALRHAAPTSSIRQDCRSFRDSPIQEYARVRTRESKVSREMVANCSREAAEEARLSLIDKTAGCCYFLCPAASPCSGLFLSKSSPTRLLIGKGSLPGVAPLGHPAIQPAWKLLEGSDPACATPPRPPVR